MEHLEIDIAARELEELYRRHNQVEYKRENFVEAPIEDCKDANGNWTKWVKERMNSEQRVKFNNVMDKLRNLDEPLDYLTDNHVMRFLNACEWDKDEELLAISL